MPYARPRRPTVIMLAILLLFFAPIVARAALFAASDAPRSWRDADWSSAALLPAAERYPHARLVVYSGRTGGWRETLTGAQVDRVVAAHEPMMRQFGYLDGL